jgi:hypothetical protein
MTNKDTDNEAVQNSEIDSQHPYVFENNGEVNVNAPNGSISGIQSCKFKDNEKVNLNIGENSRCSDRAGLKRLKDRLKWIPIISGIIDILQFFHYIVLHLLIFI